jgi:hypothetical protein
MKKAKQDNYPWAELFATFPDDYSSRELTSEEIKQCEDLRKELRRSQETQERHNI